MKTLFHVNKFMSYLTLRTRVLERKFGRVLLLETRYTLRTAYGSWP